MRALFRATVATTLVAGLGACSSVKKSVDDTGLNDAPVDGNPVSITNEIPSAFVPDEDSNVQSTVSTTESSVIAPRHREAITRAPRRESIVTQTVAGSPFQADGFWMNAFYFVRKGDSWESISKNLYGRPDRAKLLKHWNPTLKLVPGYVLYYNSPSRPDDSQQIKVFSEDFSQPLQQVVVQSGETMKSIALAHYGSTASWLEIATLNPSITPKQLELGQTLTMQPAHVDTSRVLNDLVAQAQNAKTAPVDQTAQADKSETLERSSKESAAPPTAGHPTVGSAFASFSLKKPGFGLPAALLDKLLYGALGLLVVALVIGASLRRRRLGGARKASYYSPTNKKSA